MNKVKFLVATLLGVLFVACSEEENLSQTGKTGFLISLAEDVKVESRSTPEELGEPVASQFNLKITNQVTGSELYSGSYTEDLIPASAGMYEIEATYGDNRVLALDAPYYKGTAEADLADGESKTVQVNCKVANALASVVFSDGGALKFEDQFSECELNVLVAGDRALIDGVKSAYYRAGSTPTFEFRGILKDGGEEVVQTLTDDKFSDPATFAAGAHCVITLKIGAVEPGVKIEISKVEVNEVTVSETIPMKWLPKPKVTATGFDSNNTLAFVETEQKQAALNLDLSSALQDIKFKFNFEDEQFASLDKEKEYLLSTDKVTIEQALGITLPSIGDKPESIDLSGLIAKLQTNAGVPTNNSIEIDVQANNRWSSDAIEGESTPNLTYTLTCNKPEFTVDAYPGNIWTKEFTVNVLREEQVTSGDFTKLSSDMTYQYSADGQMGWTNLSDGMRQDQLQPGGTYYIRGLYRGEVPGEATMIQTYPEISLENGGLEDWDQEERGYYFAAFGINAKKLRTYYPWTEKPYWNTNNDYTTRYRDASIASFSTVYLYNSFPAVSYTKDANSGIKAAELRNTAAGRGNTSSSASSYDFNNVPGELFLGDISVFTEGTAANPENDYYNITPGRNFASKPTGLRFYYKYEPYDTDFWKVYIALYDENNNIMAENTVTGSIQESYTFIDVPINYVSDNLNACPTKIYVYFASSIYSGSQLPYHKMNVTTWYEDSQRTDETLSGSVFTVDDISLIYDK